MLQAMADGLQFHPVVPGFRNVDYYVKQECNASLDVICGECQECPVGFYANVTCGQSYGNDRLDTSNDVRAVSGGEEHERPYITAGVRGHSWLHHRSSGVHGTKRAGRRTVLSVRSGVVQIHSRFPCLHVLRGLVLQEHHSGSVCGVVRALLFGLIFS
jgi:hypothetical protein